MSDWEAGLPEAIRLLREARRVVVLSGAGISKESGIPTFRDAQTGLWANYNAEDLATREGFTADPRMVWDWYDYRRNRVWETAPNSGHRALVTLENHCRQAGKDFSLITQNIDNLHQQAGSRDVLELHGSIFRYKCLGHNHLVTPNEVKAWGVEDLPPKCPKCQSWVRPDVVWFGEMLPETTLNRAFAEAEQADCVLVVGTSGVVHPAASVPVVAKQHGAVVIEVNPEPSALTGVVVDCFLQGPSGEVLPALMVALAATDAL